MNEHSKDKSLQEFRTPPGEYLTSNQGVRIQDNQNSLKAGERGPTLMEDFILREKITHFDHERIPERVVHARGAGAHGYFQVYESLAEYTSAAFLQDPAVRTPVFVRFSTVVGSRGSADTVRDARGFAMQGVAGAKSKGKVFVEEGVVTMRQGASLDAFIEEFIQAISEHRHWGRFQKEHMLA